LAFSAAKDGKTYYRTYVAGSNQGRRQGLCAALKAKGKDCIVR